MPMQVYVLWPLTTERYEPFSCMLTVNSSVSTTGKPERFTSYFDDYPVVVAVETDGCVWSESSNQICITECHTIMEEQPLITYPTCFLMPVGSTEISVEELHFGVAQSTGLLDVQDFTQFGRVLAVQTCKTGNDILHRNDWILFRHPKVVNSVVVAMSLVAFFLFRYQHQRRLVTIAPVVLSLMFITYLQRLEE